MTLICVLDPCQNTMYAELLTMWSIKKKKIKRQRMDSRKDKAKIKKPRRSCNQGEAKIKGEQLL